VRSVRLVVRPIAEVNMKKTLGDVIGGVVGKSRKFRERASNTKTAREREERERPTHTQRERERERERREYVILK
jgi:hypothetical protein